MKKLVIRTAAALALLLVLSLAFAACEASNEEGFAFKTPNGVSVSIGDSDDVIAELGTYRSVNESASCGGIPGNDFVYNYQGFRVKTTPAEGGGNVICQIELTDDTLKTPEGLYIGMSAEDAKTAMSEQGSYASTGAGFSCTKGGCKLQITVRNGVVSGIAYLPA